MSQKEEKESDKYKMYYHTVLDPPKDTKEENLLRTSTGQKNRKKKLDERTIKSSQQLTRIQLKSKSGSKKGEIVDNDQPFQSYDKLEEGRIFDYKHEEEGLVCFRFPHLDFCACKPEPCRIQIKDPFFVEILSQVFVGSLASALATKLLLRAGITHVLNLSATEYTKRTKYFQYLTIDVYESSEEDIKKFFRLTNRFIQKAKNSKGKVLIHCQSGKSVALAFAIAYLIAQEKMPLKMAFDGIKAEITDIMIPAYFYKQLEQYDLEKLVMVKNNPSEAE